jgi:hypothetical protein
MLDEELLESRSQPEGARDASGCSYIVVLRRDLKIADVTRLLHYLSDFGSGNARGYERDGGWCLRLIDLADVRLLTFQCAEMIEEVARI